MKKQIIFYTAVLVLGIFISVTTSDMSVYIGKGWATFQGFIGGFVLMAGAARLLLIYRENKK